MEQLYTPVKISVLNVVIDWANEKADSGNTARTTEIQTIPRSDSNGGSTVNGYWTWYGSLLA